MHSDPVIITNETFLGLSIKEQRPPGWDLCLFNFISKGSCMLISGDSDL